jgi:hypothetical protein
MLYCVLFVIQCCVLLPWVIAECSLSLLLILLLSYILFII